MNKYLISYYSDHTGEIVQNVLTASDEREAVIMFFYFLGDTEAAGVLDDIKAFPTLEDVKLQIAQWDATIAIMPLIMKL